MKNINESPSPAGTLISQTIAMPRETNANGDIFGGWLLSQMDLAVAIVAISIMSFVSPVPVGAVVSCYAHTSAVGTSSIKITIEAWISHNNQSDLCKVTEGEFVFVAIDDSGNTRALPNS